MKKIFKKMSVFLFILGFIILGKSNIVNAKVNEKRIFGNNRYETSKKIVDFGWGKSDYAIIASGEGFADALSAAPLAKKYDAPIILTECKKLNQNAKDQLKRLSAKNVIIVGGPGSISISTENAIKQLGINTRRIYGQSRFDTSLEVAKEIGIKNGIVVTNGYGFADALSMASVAANKQIPIILTPHNVLPKNTKTFINNNDYDKSYVLGGTAVVNNAIEKSLKNCKRLYGNNRYDTNAEILKEFSQEFNLDKVYIAAGTNYPDALSVSALAGKTNSPIALVSNSVQPSVMEFIRFQGKNIKNINIIGGTAVVKDDIAKTILDGMPVNFKDRKFEQIIRNKINKFTGDILNSDVKNIYWLLRRTSNGVTDITGIENLVNLTQVNLAGNKITDISPLKDLTKLTYIHLFYNGIDNIDSLANLKNLEEVFLGSNKINDIKALSNLTKLKELDLSKNNIRNISSLKNLTNLRYLDLRNNDISDISVLKGLTKLSTLKLQGNKISDSDIKLLKNALPGCNIES